MYKKKRGIPEIGSAISERAGKNKIKRAGLSYAGSYTGLFFILSEIGLPILTELYQRNPTDKRITLD